MTTDTKAVARWGYDGCMDVVPCPDGEYVLLTDHKRVVAELTKLADGLSNALEDASLELVRLRAELAAKSKDADVLADKALTYLTGAYHDAEVEPSDSYMRRRVLEAKQLDQAIDAIKRGLK